LYEVYKNIVKTKLFKRYRRTLKEIYKNYKNNQSFYLYDIKKFFSKIKCQYIKRFRNKCFRKKEREYCIDI
jgi:hypothetical protein